MAGDWIPIRINLRTDPRVIKIAGKVNRTPQHVMGCLMQVWGAANEHSTDGKLMGYSLAAIDDLTGTKRFGEAMVENEWLVQADDGLLIPDFDRYNSDGAKARLKHSRRVAESRERHKTVTPSAQNRHKSRTNGSTTEQNRTEEKKQQQGFPLCAGSSAAPDAVACPPAAAPAAAGISPILQALHDRGIGEPTASALIDEGVTGADIASVERVSDAGDGPGLWVHRLRESIAKRATTAAAKQAREEARAAFEAIPPDDQGAKLLAFREWAAGQGLEVRHMPDPLIAKWVKFVDWCAFGAAGGEA